MAFESATIRDSFTRADEGPPMTGWGTWFSTGLKVISNQCAPADSSDNGGYLTTGMTGPDVEAYITISTLPAASGETGIVARGNPSGPGFTGEGYAVHHFVQPGTDQIWIESIVNGVWTLIGGPYDQDMSAGDKLGIRCVASTISAWVFTGGGWVLVGSVTDNSVPGTGSENKIGLYNFGNGSATARYDDLFAGVIAVRGLATAGGKVGRPTLGLRKAELTWAQLTFPSAARAGIVIGTRATATATGKSSSPKIRVSPGAFTLIVSGNPNVSGTLTATYSSTLAATVGKTGTLRPIITVTGVRGRATAAGKAGITSGASIYVTGVAAGAQVDGKTGSVSLPIVQSSGVGADLLHQNYAAITGGTIVAGALTTPTYALRFPDTGTWVVPDSPSDSLTVADGAAGGAAMSGWMRVSAWPASPQTIIGKSGAYELGMDAAGKLTWTLTNGFNTVTVTSNATITVDEWYHVAAVYNGDYTGATQLGKSTVGTTSTALPPDFIAGAETSYENLKVTKAQMFEKGTLNTLYADLVRYNPYTQWVAAVLYADSAGQPGALIEQSDPILLGDNIVTRSWVPFTMTSLIYAGSYWPGLIGGPALTGPAEYPVILVGQNTSGGIHRSKHAGISDGLTVTGRADDPFGTPATSSTVDMAVFASYTPHRRGDEGFALVYLNGQVDSSTSYTHGIADTSTSLQHPSGVAVDLDDWAIFDHKLTAVQVATHYAAR